MAWLAGWNHRLSWAADSSDTDKVLTGQTLTKPSIPIFFGETVGIGDAYDNWTPIADEIGTAEADWNQMAITYGDTEELYVEIEDFDSVNKTAVVWIGDNTDSSWTVVSGTDRTGWIYYKDGNTNTDRVGAIGSTPGEKVWDSNHVMVQHMVNATTRTILDSTSNDNDGAKKTVSEPVKTANGKIGDAQLFDGDADYIDVNNDNSLQITAAITIEVQLYTDAYSHFGRIVEKAPYYFYQNGGFGTVYFNIPGVDAVLSNDSLTLDDWTYAVARYDQSQLKIYFDGVENATKDASGAMGTDTTTLRIGHTHVPTTEKAFDGVIDEVRVSNSSRSAAWIKANFYFQDDDLLYFGIEETLFAKIANQAFSVIEKIANVALADIEVIAGVPA